MTYNEEQWAQIEAELKKATKLRRKKTESDLDWAERLVREANKLDDDAWDELAEDTQEWINQGVEAIEEGNAVMMPGQEEEEEAAEEEPEEEEAPAPKRGRAKKAPAKKAAPAKKTTAAKANGAKKAPAKKDAAPGRRSKYDGSATVSVLVEENPHRSTAKDHAKFKKIKDGKTVDQLLKAGVELSYLRYAEGRGILEIG